MQKRSMNSNGHAMMVALVILATRGHRGGGTEGTRKLSFISVEIGCQYDRLIAGPQLSRKQDFNRVTSRNGMLRTITSKEAQSGQHLPMFLGHVWPP